MVITFFRDYFSANELLTENLILYSLRNVTLGAMTFFGMAISEVLTLEKEMAVIKEKLDVYEIELRDAKKEAELEIREAKIEAKKIVTEAGITAKEIMLKKNKIESELKGFIQAEKELIRKYEDI